MCHCWCPHGRYRLLSESDEILADWRESDEHDAELEAFSIRLSKEGIDEDGFNEIKEKEEEEEADGVVQQLAVLPATTSIEPNAPPVRTLGFTSRGLGAGYLLVELFVPEVPEVDDDGREGEADDTPGIVFLGACMVELKEVADLKETRISKKKDPYKDPDALCYRELKLNAGLRVSEDGLEALPPGTQVKNLEMTLRLWDGAVLGRELAKGSGVEAARLQGFDTWLAQLKLVMVEELMLSQNLAAIRSRAYDLQPQQSDRVLPEIETKIYTTYDASGKAVPEAQVQRGVCVRALVWGRLSGVCVCVFTHTAHASARLSEREREGVRERERERDEYLPQYPGICLPPPPPPRTH